MIKVVVLFAISIFTQAALATDSGINTRLYKIAYGGALNHYKAVVELNCNNGEFAGWRTKQNDVRYIQCEERAYSRGYSEIALDISNKPINLSQAEFLKIELAKKMGIKTYILNGVERINLKDPSLREDQLIQLANELSILVSLNNSREIL